MLTPKFKVAFLEEASEFLDNLDEKVREKSFTISQKQGFQITKSFFKKITEEIWEFGTLFNKTHYRLFAFWDKSEKNDTIVIVTHGLIRKTDKIPQGDLDKAERLRKKYFELKCKKK